MSAPRHISEFEKEILNTRTKILPGRQSKSVYEDLELLNRQFSTREFKTAAKQSQQRDQRGKAKSMDWETVRQTAHFLNRFAIREDLFNLDIPRHEHYKAEAIDRLKRCQKMNKAIKDCIGIMDGLSQVRKRSADVISKDIEHLKQRFDAETDVIQTLRRQFAYSRITVQKLTEETHYYYQATKDKQAQLELYQEKVKKSREQVAVQREIFEAKKKENLAKIETIRRLKILKTEQIKMEKPVFSTAIQSNKNNTQSGFERESGPHCKEQVQAFQNISNKGHKCDSYDQSKGSKGICETCQAKTNQSKTIFSLGNVDSKNLLSSKVFKE